MALPEQFRHLTGDALYEALTTDDEIWDSARFAREAGRSVGRIWIWHSARRKLDAWERRDTDAEPAQITDRTAPRCLNPDGRSPVWRAGTLRRWMMQVGLMTREGAVIKYKPTGRPRGAVDIDPRAKKASPLRETAPQILAEYRTLRDQEVSQADAVARLAETWKVTGRQLMRRLEVGRTMEAEAAVTQEPAPAGGA